MPTGPVPRKRCDEEAEEGEDMVEGEEEAGPSGRGEDATQG